MHLFNRECSKSPTVSIENQHLSIPPLFHLTRRNTRNQTRPPTDTHLRVSPGQTVWKSKLKTNLFS